VQDIHSIVKFSHVKDPIRRLEPNADFFDSSPHALHWLPVQGVKPKLNQPQLVTCGAFGFIGKSLDLFETVTKPAELFRL
jgi:hypothetical protein